MPWFVVGSFTTSGGATVHGDVARFLSGDPTAGSFMTGFFPIMMFALPAAALAIYQEADPGRRKVVGGVMLSGALTSFLTGVTEPLEFAFMFVAWPLYLLHAVLTGTSMALVNALGIKRRLRLLRRRDRLRAELHHRDPSAGAARSIGLGYARRLLRAVPVRDPAVRPGHARPGARRGRLCGRRRRAARLTSAGITWWTLHEPRERPAGSH